jgi:hypothetical protein
MVKQVSQQALKPVYATHYLSFEVCPTVSVGGGREFDG